MADRERQLWLLLTATVDPMGMSATRRATVRVRLKDYELALGKWLTTTAVFDSIVFCENSAHDLSPLRRLSCKRVRFISFNGNDYPRHLGKGYGELNILRHALNESCPAENDLIVKVTGRYYLRNAAYLTSFMRNHPECDVFCDSSISASFVESKIFAGTRGFIEKYLLTRQASIDDTAEAYFEHALHAAIHAAMADGLRCEPFPEGPQIEGVSGTSNRSYDPSAMQAFRYQSIDVFKKVLWYPALRVTKPLRHQLGARHDNLAGVLARCTKFVRSKVDGGSV